MVDHFDKFELTYSGYVYFMSDKTCTFTPESTVLVKVIVVPETE